MLLKPTTQQFEALQSKLERSGIQLGRGFAKHAENRAFYQILSDIGLYDSRTPGKRAKEPSYKELGFSRNAGSPSTSDIERYKEITGGGILTEDGFVTQALFFDNDLIADRYSVATYNLLTDLYSKYIGRANDFDHYFNVTQARSRIIDLEIGTDSGTALHPDTPVEALRRFSPNAPSNGTYTALFGDLAFPKMENDPESVTDRVKGGLIQDISICFQNAHKTTYCSLCLLPMDSFWFWSYCEEHGFPGGRLGSDAVVAIMDRASDAYTFGLVSDGAVKRAKIVLNPIEEEAQQLDLSAIKMWIKASPIMENQSLTKTISVGGTDAATVTNNL